MLVTRFSDSDLVTSLQQSRVHILTRLTWWRFRGQSLCFRASGFIAFLWGKAGGIKSCFEAVIDSPTLATVQVATVLGWPRRTRAQSCRA